MNYTYIIDAIQNYDIDYLNNIAYQPFDIVILSYQIYKQKLIHNLYECYYFYEYNDAGLAYQHLGWLHPICCYVNWVYTDVGDIFWRNKHACFRPDAKHYNYKISSFTCGAKCTLFSKPLIDECINQNGNYRNCRRYTTNFLILLSGNYLESYNISFPNEPRLKRLRDIEINDSMLFDVTIVQV